MNNCLFFAIKYWLVNQNSSIHYENNSKRSKWIRWMIMGHFYIIHNKIKISYVPYKKTIFPFWFNGYVKQKKLNEND